MDGRSGERVIVLMGDLSNLSMQLSFIKKKKKNLHIFTYKSEYLRDLTCTLGLLASKIRLPKHKHSDRQYDNVQSDEQAGSIYSVDTLKRRMTHIHGRHSSMSLI